MTPPPSPTRTTATNRDSPSTEQDQTQRHQHHHHQQQHQQKKRKKSDHDDGSDLERESNNNEGTFNNHRTVQVGQNNSNKKHNDDDRRRNSCKFDEYQGFSFQRRQQQHKSQIDSTAGSGATSSLSSSSSSSGVDCIDFSIINNDRSPFDDDNIVPMKREDFFKKYIAARKPCIIKGCNKISITPNDLSRVAGKQTVQVERRFSTTENFGQNRTTSRQVLMTINDFIHELSRDSDNRNRHSDSGELLYLSTQQPDADSSPDNDDQIPEKGKEANVDSPSLHAFRTAPCRQLLGAKLIPSTLPWAGHLKLESCNLWMGKSQNGSSSGLHHDYHDNFYILQQGKKQFELYSPDTAPYMKTFGQIDKIHFNGVISYVGAETRPDGVPIRKDIDGGINDVIDEDDADADDANDDDNEEEFVFGKGFDYQDSDEEEDEEDVYCQADDHDDFDEIFAVDTKPEKANLNRAKNLMPKNVRPNSFSMIDLKNKETEEEMEKHKLNKVVVTLNSGDILYLPAGFFHCVTSFSPDEADYEHDDSSSTEKKVLASSAHIAINYWYHPPDRLDCFELPYTSPDDLP